MAHNIYKDSMFYYGETPWHGIGTKLNRPATAIEAIKAAKLDYEVALHPLYCETSNGSIIMKNKRATVREDTNMPLSIVSSRYKVVQNKDAFDFFDNVVGEKKAIYHTAGALGEGERIWIMAQLPGEIILGKNDKVEKYLLLSNSHDGSSAVKMYFTPIRVVCQNTLIMSEKDSKSGIAISHAGSIKDKIKEARMVLGIANKAYDSFEIIAKELVKKEMSDAAANKYFDDLVFENDPKRREENLLNDRFNRLLYLFNEGKGNDAEDIQHTAWAAYNAVTEYCDHCKKYNTPNNRLKDIWFGDGANMKARAYSEILTICNLTN